MAKSEWHINHIDISIPLINLSLAYSPHPEYLDYWFRVWAPLERR